MSAKHMTEEEVRKILSQHESKPEGTPLLEEDCANCKELDCPANPNNPSGDEDLIEAIRDGRMIAMGEDELPDWLREAIVDRLGGGSPDEYERMKRQLRENDEGAYMFLGEVEQIIKAQDRYNDIQSKMADLAGNLALLRHQVAQRKATVLKDLAELGGLNGNPQEREINIEAAVYGDEKLAKLLEIQSELEAELAAAEHHEESVRRTINTLLSVTQAQLRHFEVSNEDERLMLERQQLENLTDNS